MSEEKPGTEDIVERLRQYPCPHPIDHDKAVDCVAAGQCGCCEKDVVEAAARIQADRARIAELEKALEPFAREADRFPNAIDDVALIYRAGFTVGDLRRARALKSP